MSESKLSHSCVVLNCNISSSNKPPYVNLHPFPSSNEMRNKWLTVLKSRCTSIDWSKGRICSNHFDSKFFDPQRQLRSNAVPTKFPKETHIVQKYKQTQQPIVANSRLDRLFNNLSVTALQEDIKSSMQQIKMPESLSHVINHDLKSPLNASKEFQLCLLLKKQENLISRLNHENTQIKKQLEMLQKNMEDSGSAKKEMEKSVEHYKYIAKCLQEKHATLEEQIEILTAVETR